MPDTGYPAILPYRIFNYLDTLPDIQPGAAARWLLTTHLQQRGFAILFEDAFRGKYQKFFRFCSLKFIKKM